MSSLVVIYAIVGGRLGVSAQNNSSLPQLDVFVQVFDRIRSDYVDETSPGLAITGAIRGLVERVDPYGGYLSPKDVAFYKDYNPEKTVGIGDVL
jgi:carboxyl-terminal processing protease